MKKDLQYYLFWTASILAAPVLVPLRVVVFSLTMLYCYIYSFLLIKVMKVDFTKPLSQTLQRVINFLTRISARGVLFGTGFWRVQYVNPELRPAPERCHVAICNHISSLDMAPLSLAGFISYVSKQEVAKMPIFGSLSVIQQCIFVDRKNKDSAKQAQIDLQARIAGDVWQEGKPREFPPLCVFPEATTVNQRALIQFKRGVFVAGKPVTCIGLRIQSRYRDPSDASQNGLKCYLLGVLALFTKMELIFFGDYVPSPEEVANADLYAGNVRQFYSQHMGVPVLDCTYKDKLYFREQIDSSSDGYALRFEGVRGRHQFLAE